MNVAIAHDTQKPQLVLFYAVTLKLGQIFNLKKYLMFPKRFNPG